MFFGVRLGFQNKFCEFSFLQNNRCLSFFTEPGRPSQSWIHHRIAWSGRYLRDNLVSRAGTPSTRPVCSEPHPDKPSTIWERQFQIQYRENFYLTTKGYPVASEICQGFRGIYMGLRYDVRLWDTLSWSPYQGLRASWLFQ